jgi:UDP-2,3-diacylglucosamine pyrophosphatase LpxH
MRLALIAALAALALAAPTATADEVRHTVFVSDFHMGLGKDASGHWEPTEDFRWPVALRHFLDYASRESGNRTDLVIAGDFLELWQPPTQIECEGVNADYGCTLEEMLEIERIVLAGHAAELADLARFAATGSNCIHVIPGNHDATLVVDPIWRPLRAALAAKGGCVQLVADGVWTSPDGRILAEHGHQIGWDPNRYNEWPSITKHFGGTTYVRRPWGEQFVQKLFNEEERTYPLVDNLSPSSAGARYRMADRGALASTADIARFLRFNLLETSLGQKIAALGGQPQGAEQKWDVEVARSLGHELFLGALAPEDPLAVRLSAAGAEGDAARRELDALARDKVALPAEQVEALCDQLAERKHVPLCQKPALGGAIEGMLVSRKRVVGPHVKQRYETHTNTRTFVYGHTHAFETAWETEVASRVKVTVLNDGAFQRVIDDGKFGKLAAARQLEPGEAMKIIRLDELPACYTFVRITPRSGVPKRELSAWFMPENASQGEVVDVCDSRCAQVGHGCN